MDDWRQTTKQLYDEKGLGSRVGFGNRPALIVVDMANGFTDPTSPLGGDLDSEVAAIGRLLETCRRAGHPVYFLTVAYRPDFSDAATFIKKVPALHVLVEGSSMVEIDARIAPRDDEPVLVKKFASAFFGTDLAERMHMARVDTAVVTGCSTSGCVRASVIDAMQHGFRTIVVADAVGDRAPGPHEANLFDMDAKYADVVDLDDALAELERLDEAGSSAA